MISLHRSKLFAVFTLLTIPLGACDKGKDDEAGNDDTNAGETGETGETGDPDMGQGNETLQWYTSCGDPVCSGYDGPWPDVPACDGVSEGDPCDVADATCDFMSDCNAVMVCATEDPKQQVGGCPISRAALKQDISYTDASALSGYYEDLLELRLATWRYRDRSDAKQSLGVILEDGEAEIWADPANDRVDLYSYGSLAIAGVQVQAAELADLRAQMESMQRELAQLREQAARCSR